MKVELIYEKTCPNIEAARVQLLRAFSEAGVTPRWQEWEVSSPDAPPHVHGYGSPTILVDGRDVCRGVAEGDDYCCRVYSYDGEGNSGVPAVSDIVSALKSVTSPPAANKESRWSLNAAMLPGVGAALLPKLACPACWPAYAGLLSSLGVGFFDYTPYLLPLTAVFLVIALAALGYRAPQRRGHKPLVTGILGALIVLVGKFHYDSDTAMYAGLSLLVLASLWNTWPKLKSSEPSCPACVATHRD